MAAIPHTVDARGVPALLELERQHGSVIAGLRSIVPPEAGFERRADPFVRCRAAWAN
jgi:hypothetical protein